MGRHKESMAAASKQVKPSLWPRLLRSQEVAHATMVVDGTIATRVRSMVMIDVFVVTRRRTGRLPSSVRLHRNRRRHRQSLSNALAQPLGRVPSTFHKAAQALVVIMATVVSASTT